MSEDESSGSDSDDSSKDEVNDLIILSDDDDDFEELTKTALNSIAEFTALSPKSKLRASCQCGDCGFDARGSHHSCYKCGGNNDGNFIYVCSH